MLIRNGKSANRNELQNRKTGVFLAQKPKNRSKTWPKPQNRKSQCPPSFTGSMVSEFSLIGDVTPSDGSSNFFLISQTIRLFLGVRTRDDFINIIKTAVCVSSIYIQMTPICIWMKITFITERWILWATIQLKGVVMRLYSRASSRKVIRGWIFWEMITDIALFLSYLSRLMKIMLTLSKSKQRHSSLNFLRFRSVF